MRTMSPSASGIAVETVAIARTFVVVSGDGGMAAWRGARRVMRALLVAGAAIPCVAMAPPSAMGQDDSQFVSQTVSTSMSPGGYQLVSITMRNMGTTTWTRASGYNLGSLNPMDNTVWGVNRAYLPGEAAIAPGQTATFTFSVQAPSTPGTYAFQWAMLREGAHWFGPLTPNTQVVVEVTDRAQFVAQSAPSTMYAGDSATVSVTMKNTGVTTWTKAGGYKLIHVAEGACWGPQIIELGDSSSVAPGQSHTFTFDITAPAYACPFRWAMSRSGVAFADFTPPLDIEIVELTDDAQFISQNARMSLRAGESATVSIAMKNTGNTTWTRAGRYNLGSQNPQDNTVWGVQRAFLSDSAAIAPGQAATFIFDIVAPSTPGTYAFQWRMVQDGVHWFGATTPNVQVVVGAADDAQPVSQSAPSSLRVGENATVSVTMKNTGTTTWTRAGGYKLIHLAEFACWGPHFIELGDSDAVAPGQQHTFSFGITAPAYSCPFRWAMYRAGGPFGTFTPAVDIAIVESNDDAQVIAQSVPSSLRVGEHATALITMKNTGETTWTGAGRYSLGSQNPQDNTVWGIHRVSLGADAIAPGQTVTFTLDIIAPSTPGTYDFQWRMVLDGVHWFGATTANVQVVVEAKDDAAFVTQSAPSSLRVGESATVSVTMKNTGDTAWTRAAGYRLVHFSDGACWGTRYVELSEVDVVAPGGQHTFTFRITAPSGECRFRWIMGRDVLFGAVSPEAEIVIVDGDDHAVFVSQSTPPSLRVGESATVSVTMKNTGVTTWTKAGGYALVHAAEAACWGPHLVELDDSDVVAPGQPHTFIFDITAPAYECPFRWAMYRAGSAFGALTPPVEILIVDAPAPSVMAAQQAALPGEPLAVSIANGPGSPGDWVGLFLESSADVGQALDVQYLDGSQTPPATGITDATLTFTAPDLEGRFVFRLFGEGGYDRLAQSNAIRIATPTPVSVQWTNLVNAIADEDTLTSTATVGWKGGASSVQEILSGSGYVEWVVTYHSQPRVAGLSHGDTDQSYPDIDFGVVMRPDGVVAIKENGVGVFDPAGVCGLGRRLRVAVEAVAASSVVKYLCDGAVLYTSKKAPEYPLLVDTSFYGGGGTLQGAVITVTPGPPVAKLTASPFPRAGEPISFDGSASWDPDGSILSFAWDFGDGTTDSGAIVEHTYAAGTYVATLTVTDDEDFVAAVSSKVKVEVVVPVTWTNLVNAVVEGDTLTSTAAGGWTGGASSIEQIISGDGFAEWDVSESVEPRLCGLSHGNTGQSPADVDFAFLIWPDGSLAIRENNVSALESAGICAPGGRLRVAVEGGAVRYFCNGKLLYTSAKVPTYPLLLDTSFLRTGGTIQGAVMGGPSLEQ